MVKALSAPSVLVPTFGWTWASGTLVGTGVTETVAMITGIASTRFLIGGLYFLLDKATASPEIVLVDIGVQQIQLAFWSLQPADFEIWDTPILADDAATVDLIRPAGGANLADDVAWAIAYYPLVTEG